MKRYNLKEKHELEVCQEFLQLYNQYNNLKFDLLRLGDASVNEPDCICSNKFAIELFGVYDNEYQAEKLWSVSRKKFVYKEANYQLCSLENLQNIIGKKLEKLNDGNYSGFSGKIILLCNLQSPLLEDHEIKNYVDQHISFAADGHFDNYFYEVWITWKADSDGSRQILKLE